MHLWPVETARREEEEDQMTSGVRLGLRTGGGGGEEGEERG